MARRTTPRCGRSCCWSRSAPSWPPGTRSVTRPWSGTSTPSARTGNDYRGHADGFHAAIYGLAGNQIIALLTQAITRIVTEQLGATMDPIELRSAVVDEHAALARAIAGGQQDVAGRLMHEHLRAQHEHFHQHAPERIGELIEWC